MNEENLISNCSVTLKPTLVISMYGPNLERIFDKILYEVDSNLRTYHAVVTRDPPHMEEGGLILLGI
jgi:hypothetical protein